MLLFNLTLIMHCPPGILTSPKKWETKFTPRKINAFGVVCSYTNHPYFQKRVWNSVKNRFNQSIKSIVFKYFIKQYPSYLNEVFELACSNNLRIRNSYLKLICPFRKSKMGQNALSFIGPSIWNKRQRFSKKPIALMLSDIISKKYYLSRLN